jgi:hypothetical protein
MSAMILEVVIPDALSSVATRPGIAVLALSGLLAAASWFLLHRRRRPQRRRLGPADEETRGTLFFECRHPQPVVPAEPSGEENAPALKKA